MNNKIVELNDSLKYYKNLIEKKENLIKQLKIDNKNANSKIKEQTNIKTSSNFHDLIYEKLEELTFLTNIKNSEKLLNIEQISSFYFLHKKKKEDNINNNINIINNGDIEKLENKIEELNLAIESKENEIKKYKNENSILKSFTKTNKNNQKDEDDSEKQKQDEEIEKLKNENQIILDEKRSLEDNFKKLLSDNKNKEIQLDSKNSEIKILENNIKELEEQVKELQMKNIQKIYNEQNSIKNEEEESRNIKKNLLEADTDKNNEIISQLKEEIKEKENEIEYLKIEIQELKSKIEDNEDNYIDSSLKNSELNDKYNTALEEKVKFLTERNEYYQKLYDEDKIKLQNLENINNNLKKENEELKNNKNFEKIEEKEESGSFHSNKDEIKEEENEQNETKKYSVKNYNVLCDKIYGELKWYLLSRKKEDIPNEDDEKLNYEDLFWVPKINIIDIDEYPESNNENEIKKIEPDKKISNKIYKSEIHLNREKEISFSNISFNNNSDEINKNKQNSNNNSSSLKRGSIFSLGNGNIINDDNSNDYNKLMEKFKSTLEKLNITEDNYIKLQKKK